MKQVFFRLIWTFWLLLLGSLLTIAQPNEKPSPSVTSVHCAPVIAAWTFSYDEQNIPSVAYDTQSRTKFGYDVPLLHARGEGGIWSAGGCALLVDLANGLAAKAGGRLADDVIHVSPNGVAFPPGPKYQIPSNYIENANRSGSYGVMQNGKFVEKLRIDAATSPGMKGPNYGHYHLDGGKTHYSPRPGDPDPGFSP